MNKSSGIISELTSLEMLKIASLPKQCSPSILRLIETHGVERTLVMNIPADTFAEDAMNFGALSSRFGLKDMVSDTVASTCHTILFCLVRMITLDIPPWDAFGQFSERTRRQIIEVMNSANRFPFFDRDTVIDVARTYGPDCINPDISYHAFEIVRSVDLEPIIYRFFVIIPVYNMCKPGSRLTRLFMSNAHRQDELKTNAKKNQTNERKVMKNAGTEGQEEHGTDYLSLEDAYTTGRFDKVRSLLVNGPTKELSYEMCYVAVRDHSDWCKLAATYLRYGLEKKREIDMGEVHNMEDDEQRQEQQQQQQNDQQRTIFDYEYIASSTNVDGFSALVGGQANRSHKVDLSLETHPYNPINLFSKENAMFFYVQNARPEQRDISNYYRVDGIVNAATSKQLMSYNIPDSNFYGFPFPEDVFFYERDLMIPSVFYNMLIPNSLVDKRYLGYFRELEKKKSKLFATKEQYAMRKAERDINDEEIPPWEINAGQDLTDKDHFDKALYETLVYKSMKPEEIRSIFEKYMDGDRVFVLDTIESIGFAIYNSLQSMLKSFARTGRAFQKIIMQNKTQQDIMYITHVRDGFKFDADRSSMNVQDIVEMNDVFVELHKKNTEVYSYLRRQYGKAPFYSDLYHNVKKIMTIEHWRAFQFSNRVSPTVKKSRAEILGRPSEMQWPKMDVGFTANLSPYGDMAVKDIAFFSDSMAMIDKHKVLALLILTTYAAYHYHHDQTHQTAAVGLSGPSSAGKSQAMMVAAATAAPGAVRMVSYSSGKSMTIEGNSNDYIMFQHEMNEADFGGSGVSKPGDKERARIFKEMLETGLVVSEVFDVNKESMENGNRQLCTYVHSAQGAHVGAFNFSLVGLDRATLNRFLMFCVLLKNATYGYRIKDAKADPGHYYWLDKDVVAEQLDDYKLLNFYGLVLEKMLQANVFGRDVCMEGVDQVLNKIDAIINEETGLKTDTRFLGQLRVLLRADVIRYVVRIVTTTPIARLYSHDKNGKFRKFNPFIFTDIGLDFLYCTKEMVIRVVTLLDDIWKRSMNKKVLQELAAFFIEAENKNEVSYMDDQSNPNVRKKDRNYVWLKASNEEELLDLVCSKIKGVQMRPEDIKKVIQEEMLEKVEVLQRNGKFNNSKDVDEEDEEESSRDDEEEEVRVGNNTTNKNNKKTQKSRAVLNKFSSALTNKGDVDDNVVGKMFNQLESIFNEDTSSSMDSEQSKQPATGRKRKRNEEQNRDHKRRTVKLDMIVKGDNIFDGKKYIAFCMEGLKRIYENARYGNQDPLENALKRVFGDSSYQVFDDQIQKVMEGLGITEEELLEQAYITGSEGPTKTFQVKTLKGKTENVTVPFWRISPVSYFERTNVRSFNTRGGYISEANTNLMFAGKKIVDDGRVDKTPSMITAVIEDFDSVAYKANCSMNCKDILDSTAIISLPPILKKYLISLTRRDYPEVYENYEKNPLLYPTDFEKSEILKATCLHFFDPRRDATNPDIAEEQKFIFGQMWQAQSEMFDKKSYRIDKKTGNLVPRGKETNYDVVEAISGVMKNQTVRAVTENDSVEESGQTLATLLKLMPELMSSYAIGTNMEVDVECNDDKNNSLIGEWLGQTPPPLYKSATPVRTDTLNRGIITPDSIGALSVDKTSVEEYYDDSRAKLGELIDDELAEELSGMNIGKKLKDRTNNNNKKVEEDKRQKALNTKGMLRDSIEIGNMLKLGPQAFVPTVVIPTQRSVSAAIKADLQSPKFRGLSIMQQRAQERRKKLNQGTRSLESFVRPQATNNNNNSNDNLGGEITDQELSWAQAVEDQYASSKEEKMVDIESSGEEKHHKRHVSDLIKDLF